MDMKWFLLSINGRISRKPIWLYILATSILSILAMVIDRAVLNTPIEQIGVVTVAFYLIFLWPGIAVTVKRMHDRNRTGWFYLLMLVPVLNIWPIVEVLFMRGTPGPNRFGDDPLGREAPEQGQLTEARETA